MARLAREEREREALLKKGEPAKASSSRWLASLWADGKAEAEAAAGGRWTAEENVVKERMRRAQDVLEESEAPQVGFAALFQA